MKKLHLLRLGLAAGVTLAPAFLHAADTRPAAPPATASATWANTPDTDVDAIAGTQTPANSYKGPAVAGPPGCPCVIGGNMVFDLKTLQPLGPAMQVPGLDDKSPRALSPDGKLFACCVNKLTFAVCDTATGAQLSTFTASLDKDQNPAFAAVSFIAFAGNDQLVSIGDARGKLSVWNIASQKSVRSFNMDGGNDPHQVALSPDGRYVAIQIRNIVSVFDTHSGARAAVMTSVPADKAAVAAAAANAPPIAAPPIRPAIPQHPMPAPPNFPNRGIARGPAPMPTPTPNPSAASRTPAAPPLERIASMAFSNDGKELAAACANGRLVVWNNNGKIVFDRPDCVHNAFNTTLTWLPDGSGWVLGGDSVYARDQKMRVMLLPDNPFSNGCCVAISRDRLLVTHFNGGESSFQFLALPWRTVNESLAAMAADKSAPLKPGSALAIDFQLGSLRNSAADVKKDFTETLTKVCSANGITISPAAPLKLEVAYSETAGKTLPIAERTRIHRDPTTGRITTSVETGSSATETQASVAVKILGSDGAVLWSKTADTANRRDFMGEINDDVLRKNALDNANAAVLNFGIPSYIPSDASIETLPIRIAQ